MGRLAEVRPGRRRGTGDPGTGGGGRGAPMGTDLTLAGWAVLALGAGVAADPGNDPAPWPQFRGPDGQGSVTGGLPAVWGEHKNVAWKTPLPGQGWSSPVVAGGKAWVTAAVPAAG